MFKKERLIALVVPFLLSTGILGCDQFNKALQPESGKSESAVQVSAGMTGTVLAKVNGEVITLERFDEDLAYAKTLPLGLSLETFDDKKNFLNELISQELFYQEAIARGIDKRKDVKDRIREAQKALLRGALSEDETKGVAIDPSEIEAAYEQSKGELATPIEARVREIVTSSEEAAREAMIALLQGEDFPGVARQVSISASAAKGGDLGFINPADKFERFNEVLLSLDVGQASQYFKAPDGNYYIVKLEEKKGGKAPSLNDIYEDLKNFLLQQKQLQRLQELADRLRRDAMIEIKEDLLR